MFDFGQFALWATVILNAVGAIILAIYILSGKKLTYDDTLYRVSLGLAVIGLLGQFARSYIGITTGIPPTDAEMPFWVFKDFSLLLLIVHIFLVGMGKIKAHINDEHVNEHLSVATAYGAWQSDPNNAAKKKKFEDGLFEHIDKTHERSKK